MSRFKENMFKTKKQILILTVSIIVVALFLNALLGFFLQSRVSDYKVDSKSDVSVVKNSEVIRYEGVDGIDALSLLKKQKSVEQDKSGMVDSINGRKADQGKREYWAFYVNDRMSNVGPAEYETKNKDMIEWKIEKY